MKAKLEYKNSRIVAGLTIARMRHKASTDFDFCIARVSTIAYNSNSTNNSNDSQRFLNLNLDRTNRII